MANLQPMRYKDYVWPHNPTSFTITYRRRMAVQEVPFGYYMLQNLGQSYRVMRGSGVFVGAGAYEEFKRLASVYYTGGDGILVHPCWQAAHVHFVKLSLSQEPRADYVAYTFEFWEDYDRYDTALQTVSKRASGTASATGSVAQKNGGVAAYHTVKKGETLWGISRSYGTTLEKILALNSGIKNPNFITVGQKVRVA